MIVSWSLSPALTAVQPDVIGRDLNQDQELGKTAIVALRAKRPPASSREPPGAGEAHRLYCPGPDARPEGIDLRPGLP